MALTHVGKVREAVWCVCEIPGFEDEEFLLLPYIRETAKLVIEDATVQEWKTNAVESTREYQPSLYDTSFIKHIWLGCRGTVINPATGERGPGPGIIREDGSIVYLADRHQFTDDHKIMLLNSRPAVFYLWLQQKCQALAVARHDVIVAQRETFPRADEVSPHLPGPEL